MTFSYSFGSIRNLNCNSSFKTHCKFYLSMKFPPCFAKGLWFGSLHLGLKWSSVWTYWLLPTGLQIPCPVLEIPRGSKLHSCPQLVHILVAKGGCGIIYCMVSARMGWLIKSARVGTKRTRQALQRCPWSFVSWRKSSVLLERSEQESSTCEGMGVWNTCCHSSSCVSLYLLIFPTRPGKGS